MKAYIWQFVDEYIIVLAETNKEAYEKADLLYTNLMRKDLYAVGIDFTSDVESNGHALLKKPSIIISQGKAKRFYKTGKVITR